MHSPSFVFRPFIYREKYGDKVTEIQAEPKDQGISWFTITQKKQPWLMINKDCVGAIDKILSPNGFHH